MREIKFRCWDICNKKFINTTYGGSPSFWIGQHGEFRGNEDIVYPTDDPAHELYILTQYTGLRYIGNDIYEGDIVKLTGPQGEFIDEIVFRCGSFMCFDRPLFYSIGDPEDKAEIIGNKFENPELLQNSQ